MMCECIELYVFFCYFVALSCSRDFYTEFVLFRVVVVVIAFVNLFFSVALVVIYQLFWFKHWVYVYVAFGLWSYCNDRSSDTGFFMILCMCMCRLCLCVCRACVCLLMKERKRADACVWVCLTFHMCWNGLFVFQLTSTNHIYYVLYEIKQALEMSESFKFRWRSFQNLPNK